jgi:hypothetical protein
LDRSSVAWYPCEKVDGQDLDICFREAYDVCANLLNVIGARGEYAVTNEIRNALIGILEGRIAYWQAEGLAPLARDRFPTRSSFDDTSNLHDFIRGDVWGIPSAPPMASSVQPQ